MKSPKDTDKHFDIAKPDSVSASHTSRPAIVGNKNEADDPMMRKENGTQPSTHKRISITPVSQKEDDTDEASIDAPAKKLPAPDIKLDENVDDSITEPSKTVSPAPAQSTSKADQLVNQKTYQLPIHRFGQQRKISFIFFIILTAVAVGAALFVIITS